MSRERTGMSTLAKVLLIGTATVGALVVGLIVAGILFLRENPEFLEQIDGGPETASMGELLDVSRDFNERFVTAADLVLPTRTALVEAAEAGSGHTFAVVPAAGEPAVFDLGAVSEYLDRVRAGEASFADGGRSESGEPAASVAPEWVAVYPDARREASLFEEFDRFSFGVEVVLSDATGEEVHSWYDELDVDIEALWKVRTSYDGEGTERVRGSSVRIAPSGDRRMVVLIFEDRQGDSLIAIVYKE